MLTAIYMPGFDPVVGRLRRSMIDVYMCENGWSIQDERFYVEVGPQQGALEVLHLCERPGQLGEGGGQVYESHVSRPVETYTYVLKFDDIRQEIDEIAVPWRKIPDPASFARAIDAYREVLDQLAAEPDEAAGDAPSLAPGIARAWDHLVGPGDKEGEEKAQYGALISTFEGYVKTLAPALGGCRGIADALCRALDAQQALWEGVVRDVPHVLSRVADACDTMVSSGSPGQIDLALDSGRLVFSVLPLPSAPLGIATADRPVTLTAVGLVSSDSAQHSLRVESFDGAVEAFRAIMNGPTHSFSLNKIVTSAEVQVLASLADSAGAVEDNRDAFKMAPGQDTSKSGNFRIDPVRSGKVVEEMRDVGEELARIARLISGAVAAYGLRGAGRRSLVDRDEIIGIGSAGPGDAFLELTGVLQRLLIFLSEQVYAVAEGLRRAMSHMLQVDADTQTRF